MVLAGLLLGSFLNVCIARLPRHVSIVWPGSHCPACGVSIRPWDNIPLVSFLLLRGRCRSCRKPISVRYPLVEAALAVLFLLAALRVPSPLPLLGAGVFCFLMLGLICMDAETFRLPDSFTLPGTCLGTAFAALPGGGLIGAMRLASHVPLALPAWAAWQSSIAGALLAAGLLSAIRWLYWLIRRQQGMGLGDVKLAACLGAWLGVTGALLTLALAVLLGAVVGLLLLRGTQAGSRASLRLPFGSFLCVAALVTLFVGEKILAWYFHFWV